jgi:hypothetical protein
MAQLRQTGLTPGQRAMVEWPVIATQKANFLRLIAKIIANMGRAPVMRLE